MNVPLVNESDMKTVVGKKKMIGNKDIGNINKTQDMNTVDEELDTIKEFSRKIVDMGESNIENKEMTNQKKDGKKYKKKLIEISMPLEDIKKISSKEKLRTRNTKNNIKLMHHYWSRKPLSVAEIVLFASIVDDPSNYLPEEKAADKRKEIYKDMIDLISCEDGRYDEILKKVKEHIIISSGNILPIVYDPFAGGGSIPFAAQILGLDAYGSDLNPVAVILNKSLIELPFKYKDQPPKSPIKSSMFKNWNNLAGLADDIRYYGNWIGEQAYKKIGYLYPKARYLDKEYTVTARIYFRSIKCSNPACLSETPLVSKYWLSTKNNIWVEPNIDRTIRPNSVNFKIRTKGNPPNGTVTQGAARCICCNAPISSDYIREQGRLGKINDNLVAIVAEGDKKKIYLSPDTITLSEVPMSDFLNDVSISSILAPYGFGYKTVGSMFNSRQRYMLETFVNLVIDARQKCFEDCQDEDYAKTMAVYLTLTVGRLANRMTSFSLWPQGYEVVTNAFSDQRVNMAWEYAEANPFSSSSGNWKDTLRVMPEIIGSIPVSNGKAFQLDAAGAGLPEIKPVLISTDPPYYNTILYADYSDFFYGIFRSCLRKDFPDLFSTINVPKNLEIVAASHRFRGGKIAAGNYFRDRLKLAIKNIVNFESEYPITIYYAEKKSFEKDSGYHTAWESILSVIIEAGLQIVRTWPMHTESVTSIKVNKNAVASSIVMVCRKREIDIPTVTRRDFVSSLKTELPIGLKLLQERSYIAPVDMQQASVGVGMSIFSRYSKVLEADGSFMSVNTALYIINQELGSYLKEQDFDVDKETRFCISWYGQFGWSNGPFDNAHTLAVAKGISIDTLQSLGIINAKGGRVRLLKREELEKDWDPVNDKNLIVWKCIQQLINILDKKGEVGAANIIRKIGNISESIKELSYRLYSLCEKKGWQEDALTYNLLISSWQPIMDKVRTQKTQSSWE